MITKPLMALMRTLMNYRTNHKGWLQCSVGFGGIADCSSYNCKNHCKTVLI